MSLLPWRWGISGMSNLIVGVRRGGGVGGLGLREGPLITGACRMWNRPLLKPLKEEDRKYCYTVKAESTGGMTRIGSYRVHNILPRVHLVMIRVWINML